MSATGAVALLVAVSARYGFHRDELYFIVAGRRLDWGYVDQPPLVPLVARLSETIGGLSPTALRFIPALAVGCVALISAAISKRFGGGPRAQTFAAACAGLTGVLLGEGHLLSTAVFDYLLWSLGLWILVRVLDGESPVLWLLLGVVVGVGTQNKHTIAFLAASILLALVSTRKRSLLRTWHPWAGVAIALVIALPNLLWQEANGWPQLEMAEALRSRSDGLIAYLAVQPALLSITLAVPAFAGLWWLARAGSARSWRPLAIVYVLLFIAFGISGGKAYYVAPMNTVLLAAGAVWFEGLTRRGRTLMAWAAGIGILVGALVALPLLPISQAGSLDATGELGETVGWPELIDQIAAVEEMIPPDQQAATVIFTGSYGEAGAVDVLGPAAGLPPAASGHNNYWLWGPPMGHGPVIGVGHVEESLRAICPRLTRVGTVSNPYGVENEELGQPLWLCVEPSGQLADIWDQVRHYN